MLSGAFFTLEINRMEVLFIMEKLQLDYELNKQVKKEKVLWYKISYFEKKYGYCDKTNNDFSRMLGVSLATIKRWIKKLEKLGLILKVKSSFWDRKLFAIRPENKVENSVDNSTSEPTNEPTNEPIYNKEYKEIKDKNNLVVSNEVIKTEQEIIDTAIQVLNKMYPAEIVKEATSIFELAKNEKTISNIGGYLYGICKNLIKNKKSKAKKQKRKEEKYKAFIERQVNDFRRELEFTDFPTTEIDKMVKQYEENLMNPKSVPADYYHDWINEYKAEIGMNDNVDVSDVELINPNPNTPFSSVLNWMYDDTLQFEY